MQGHARIMGNWVVMQGVHVSWEVGDDVGACMYHGKWVMMQGHVCVLWEVGWMMQGVHVSWEVGDDSEAQCTLTCIMGVEAGCACASIMGSWEGVHVSWEAGRVCT